MHTPAIPRVARVLLDSGLPQLDHLFDYEVPEPLRQEIRVGQRVKVPLRSRQRDSLGFVIELVDESAFQGELAQLSQIVSPVPMLTPEVWHLVRAVADRAGGSAADLIRLGVPNRHVRAEKAYFASKEGECSCESESGQHREGAISALANEGDGGLAAEPLRIANTEAVSAAEQLCGGARLALTVSGAPVRLETGEWVSAWAYHFASTALATVASGRSAIVAVPDYRDLDQLDDTLKALGAQEVIRLDARRPAAERYTSFLNALEARPRLLIGNRSALYAPAHELGAMLLWNDGDPLFEEPLAPYVHVRDAALVRAQQSGAGLLLGAHVMSAEAQRFVDMGYFAEGATGARRQKIMHSGSLTADERVIGRIPEFATKKLREGLLEGPVLVQVAAPGYAPVMVCGECHDMARCSHCRGPLGQSAGGTVSCRWCGSSARGLSCETCRGTRFEIRGAGSERTAEQFAQMFPETMIVVSDGNHQRSRVDARPQVVVATRGAEPIAAGGYRAVVLLDVDRIVSAPSLKAGEDALRWWHGAASLAKEGAPIVITGGAGPMVRAFVTGREHEWLRSELQDRKQLRFPPMVRIATVTGARELVQEALDAVSGVQNLDVLGPTPAPDSTVRAIVRFGYSQGAEVAAKLRAVLVSQAASSAAKAYAARKKGAKRGAPAGALRLRFDDAQAFDEQGDELE
ncbi:hypothetical protein [Leucobacter chinensis]|uniref:primosomal protein N' family DNA-binding protein n=1 Tax=Leucobacter chinensis TaxID=2851010 RepID=UPI00350EDA9F